ncbi:MAG: alanine racemase, partial [Actinomycetota bacterium]|nr:alanine racemase [Actinomycetota bacterium]
MGLSRDEIDGRGHPVWAEIDLGAIRDNVRSLRDLAGGAELMSVVKGYAYGHGNPQCARAMLEAGASRLGVARVAEALHLRDAGIEAPIHVFTEPPYEAAVALVEKELTATVYTRRFAEILSDAAIAAGRKVPVHVKFDTGMHRVGLPADEAVGAIGALRSLRGLEIEGAWSHFAVADVPDHPFTRKQLDVFMDLVGQLERSGISLRYRHIANSAATLSFPDSHLDLVRCGVASYGLLPGATTMPRGELRPALSLRARVNMSKSVPAGEALSYGLDYELARTSRVVTVPVGYADGYDRGLSSRADVLINGKRFRVSGAVCMDQFMVDVGNEDVATGSIVTLIGADGEDKISADELAAHLDTINYEVTARIPSRVPRLYLEES